MPDIVLADLTPQHRQKLETLRRSLGYTSQEQVLQRLYELFIKSHGSAASYEAFIKHITGDSR